MIARGDLRFDGLIAGGSFASGDQVVVGCWRRSPFGPFTDAMWARADGTRVLIVGDGPQADFIWSHYWFEERITGPVGAAVSSARLLFEGGPLTISMALREPTMVSRVLGLRPLPLGLWEPWSRVEHRVLRPILAPALGDGVRTRGITRAGARERYVALGIRRADAVASVDGVGVGPAVERPRPAGFGFSEFVRRPALVRVVTVLRPPDER